MFHARGGLYFERLVDGSVRVVLKRRVTKTDGPDVAFEVVLDSLTWASVVAAVSKRGQCVEVVEAALRVHDAEVEASLVEFGQ